MPFADVPPEHPYADEIEAVASAGLVRGYADGTFRPGQPVTRGELAVVLSRLLPPAPEEPDEPEPEPPLEVTEEYPANPDVVLTPGETVQAVLAPGRVVELLPGEYGDQTLDPPAGCHIFSRGVASFTHPHKGLCSDHPWIHGGGDDVTLRGILIDGWSAPGNDPSSANGRGALELSGDRWSILDFGARRIADSVIRGGKGHRIERYDISDFGRYAFVQMRQGLIKDGKVSKLGSKYGASVPRVSDPNRGFCKFAAGADSMTVDGLVLEGIDGAGVWWDGWGTDGVVRNVVARHVEGNVVAAEISFGPFLFENVEAYDSADPHETDNPIKSVVLSHWTPDVTVRNVYGERVGNGVCAYGFTSRKQFTSGGGGYTAEELRRKLSLRNFTVDGYGFHEVARFTAGYGPADGDANGDPFVGMSWRNGTWDTGARFIIGSDKQVDEAGWTGRGMS